MATLLEIVQEFARRTGIRVPSSVSGSQDTGVLQLLGLANETCELLTDEAVWEGLIREATFTSVNGEDQGAIETLAPNGFLAIVQGTIYDRTQKVELYGPLGPQVWQQGKAFIPAGPLFRYRIRGGRLLFMPVGVAGHTCAFEYYSNFCIYNPVDDVYKDAFTKDSDVFLLDKKLLLLGLRWKWKKEKGLTYNEEYDHFVRAATNAAGRSGTKKILCMDGGLDEYAGPSLIIQPGSWSV